MNQWTDAWTNERTNEWTNGPNKRVSGRLTPPARELPPLVVNSPDAAAAVASCDESGRERKEEVKEERQERERRHLTHLGSMARARARKPSVPTLLSLASMACSAGVTHDPSLFIRGSIAAASAAAPSSPIRLPPTPSARNDLFTTQ